MMLLKKLRKGFTLIELVVVIAVIAILSAVSVISYVSITNRAKQSSDQQKVDQLNLSLAATEVSGKPSTMQKALDGLKEEGFIPENFKAQAKSYKFAYAMSKNRFVILDNNKVVYPSNISNLSTWDIWKFASNESELDSGYSHYLLKGFESDGSLEVNAGVDVGQNVSISSINYANSDSAPAQEVVIRTNGGALKVSAKNDTVHHYSDLDKLAVEKIATESYHEHGRIKVSAQVSDGHVVVESTGYINELDVPESATATASVSIKTNGVVNTAVIDSTAAKVEIASGGHVEQVVGNTSNISGAGSAGAKASAVSKTFVDSAITLQTALNNGDKYIVLSNDFTTSKFKLEGETSDRYFFTVSKDVTIDGNGKTITANFGTNGRGVVVNSDNVTLNISNLTLKGTTARALQVHSNHINVVFNLNKVDLSSTMYGINICGGTLNVKLNAVDCKVSSWGALNVWGNSHVLSFVNCELIGTNNKSEAPSNNFATIALEADTTEVTSQYSAYNYVSVVGGKISAIETNSNKQFALSFNNGVVGACGSTIELSKVALEIAADDRVLADAGGGGNTIIIDGEVAWTNA